jgi:hypothetical protein
MTNDSLRRRLAAALLLLAAASGRARSAPAKVMGGPSFAEWRHGGWEFGLDTGVLCPAHKSNFSHVIDNQRAYDLLRDESVGDEVAEGFVAPPLPGSSVIAGTLRPTGDIGAHLFRQWTPWLAWGLEGGFSFRRDLKIVSRGIYAAENFLALRYSANMIHLTAPMKFGRTFGAFKPFLLAGPGLYLVQERASITFNDSDDPQLQPLDVVRRDALHAGITGGAGVEWWLDERGLIGFDVAYHRIFAGSDRLDFFLPKLRFSMLF